ncbi:uncharacterized protein LOC133420071 [Cololabis saira]|uniref:uncharacterized protein LOC133420071 n=1 Tax=Cololabis saira TaxID=129043 RepID=UPI002AD424D5|nr:uncharacterized protein LOC133420071 [Cololabis saira]
MALTSKVVSPTYVFSIVLKDCFDDELKDKNSDRFKILQTKLIDLYDAIYSAEFGCLFTGSFVIEFRSTVNGTQSGNIEVEVGVEFNKTTPIKELPENKVVEEIVKQFAVNSTVNFNVTFVSDSIAIIKTPKANLTRTSPGIPTRADANSGVSNSTVNPAATNTTNQLARGGANARTPSKLATTAATTQTSTAATTTTTTTAESIVVRRVTFKSLGETFTTDLLDASSTAFKSRAAFIKSTLEPYFEGAFSSFRSLTMISFSNGSIISNMDFRFASASVPDNIQIGNVLIRAAPNITNFNIETRSVTVEGLQWNSGVAHKISLITAVSMVLFSWLMSSQQLFPC